MFFRNLVLHQVRTLSDGRHPEHGKTGYTKKHAVDGRQCVTQLWLARFLSADDTRSRRYYQTLLMETERRGDVQKQALRACEISHRSQCLLSNKLRSQHVPRSMSRSFCGSRWQLISIHEICAQRA